MKERYRQTKNTKFIANRLTLGEKASDPGSNSNPQGGKKTWSTSKSNHVDTTIHVSCLIKQLHKIISISLFWGENKAILE
jgi:hypothetical protein